MTSRDGYTVGWVCSLPSELAAARAVLDHIHTNLPTHPKDTNGYILGSILGHNVTIGYPSGKTASAAEVAIQMRASFKSIRFIFLIGVGEGVPNTKEDIRLGDIVVSKQTASRPGLIQYDTAGKSCEEVPSTSIVELKPSTLLLTAIGKAETNCILGESQIPRYIAEIEQKEPLSLAYPGPEQDILFDSDYNHIAEPAENGCSSCNPDKIRHRPPRTSIYPKVHYGSIATSKQPICCGAIKDRLARDQGILCFETGAAGILGPDQYLIIRGISAYADSDKGELWQGYAAAAAAAYAKEILSLIPVIPKQVSLAAKTYAEAATVLDALLLTRPEVDRRSLIALKGRRVEGTCEWLGQHQSYQDWLKDTGKPILWISGGPGKGKTMLAIYITEELQPLVDSAHGVLLYYFFSNRDRNRNTAVTMMRGIIHQWLISHPHLAQHIKNQFEGSETTKYTISSFVSLWRVFLTLLHQDESHHVFCVIDGLDECEKESLRKFLDALRSALNSNERQNSSLKFILLSRPQPILLQNKLGQYTQIKLDDSGVEVGEDVDRYISAKVAELASEQTISEELLLQIRQALTNGAEGTFLWVGFVADELRGRSWQKIKKILHSVPKGLGGIYRRLLQQVENKENLVPILQWIVLAARPMTMDELTVAAEIKVPAGLEATELMKSRLTSLGLLVKLDGDVVNLVHESAKEFFQSEQVNVEGINMFHMNRHTHKKLMWTCLALIEGNYKSPGSINDACTRDSLVAYASLYWPEHFRHAFDLVDAPWELLPPFFQDKSPVREDWWRFYWEQEKYGGAPPSFTLLHLAAYFGNLAWANKILKEHALNHNSFRRLISRKDNYGRTPLFWAATRGHRDMVELLLDHGARVNSKDRSKLTALHIAVTGEHRDVVSLLLDRSAQIESKASYGDTPLIRAIQVNSKEIIMLLLQRGARVDGLPKAPSITDLKGSAESLEERANQLLGIQEQLFASRYENSSRLVDLTINLLTLSFRIPPVLHLVTLYLKYSSIGRWEVMYVLQDLVKNNKTTGLRKWAQAYIEFGTRLVEARNAKNLAVMTGLSVLIFRVVSTADLEALLVIGVLVGSSVILAAAEREWREGVDIAAETFAQFASLAYHRNAGESLHYGVREFLIDFDACIRSGSRAENVARTVVLFSTHFAILGTKDPRSIEYFSTVIAEHFEGYIGGPHGEQVFSDMTKACTNELGAISKGHDSPRLCLFLTAIFQFAQRSREKGQDQFLNTTSASCLVLCRDNPLTHRWLVAEAVPDTMSALISQLPKGPVQGRAYKAFVEWLIIGKNYGLSVPVALRDTLREKLGSIDGAYDMLNIINGL